MKKCCEAYLGCYILNAVGQLFVDCWVIICQLINELLPINEYLVQSQHLLQKNVFMANFLMIFSNSLKQKE